MGAINEVPVADMLRFKKKIVDAVAVHLYEGIGASVPHVMRREQVISKLKPAINAGLVQQPHIEEVLNKSAASELYVKNMLTDSMLNCYLKHEDPNLVERAKQIIDRRKELAALEADMSTYIDDDISFVSEEVSRIVDMCNLDPVVKHQIRGTFNK